MSDQTIYWSRLRVMPNTGTTADPDWRGTALTPNSVTAVVGGTASNGTYSITIVGTVIKPNGAAIMINEVISAVRTSETSAQMASALEANADANRDLVTHGIIVSVSTATLTIIGPPGSSLTLTASAPGSATITFPSTNGSTIGILAGSPNYSGSRYHLGKVVLQVNALTSGGVALAPGVGTQTTVDITIIEVCVVKVNGADTYRIAQTATIADCNLATEYEFPIRGAGYWTARLTGFADAVGSTAFYEVIYRDSTS